ncbi:MAG: hypothetical protein OXU81_10705, partial [Gammaproteobacteria bacterium]|nr:hypothetical protein [Gammaproteobacteria bacterium]
GILSLDGGIGVDISTLNFLQFGAVESLPLADASKSVGGFVQRPGQGGIYRASPGQLRGAFPALSPLLERYPR